MSLNQHQLTLSNHLEILHNNYYYSKKKKGVTPKGHGGG